MPAWWAWSSGHWELRHGPADEEAWLEAAYRDRTLVTRVGTLHADHAKADGGPTGRPASSSTLPGLVVQMYRHARIGDEGTVLDVGTGADYSPGPAGLTETASAADGEDVSTGRHPVIDIEENAWELRSMLEIMAPGIEHDYRENGDTRIALMVHGDGSWVRAEQTGRELPTVHQGGPRRLWDVLDEARDHWLWEGSLPLYGAHVRISPDGTIHLRRGRWKATIA
ncbi:hypothetical protein ACFY3V_17670 [Streptosporangium sp. NPDC000095]|uniref:hypothetical protein n=1 Tax=Streptosporangium sp. NPDC000095 TaxID=3366184 RepID=UPI0036B0E3EC